MINRDKPVWLITRCSKKLDPLRKNFDAWEAATFGADFPTTGA